MERFIDDLLVRQRADLDEIGREKNAILRYYLSIKRVEQSIDEMKEWLGDHPFNSKEDEIMYFRHLAPKVYWRLFYLIKMHLVESYRPSVSRERFREVLKEELKGVEAFFTRNTEICRYYYQHTSYWDEYLFTRKGQGHWNLEEPGIFIEGDFCIGTYWAAWMMANEHYRAWLEEEIETLSRPPKALSNGPEMPKLEWTASQVDLVELVYALHLGKCFNGGKAQINEIARWFEVGLGIELGNIYNARQEIARRKGKRAKFTEGLSKGLERDLEAKD
ncbi:MAG: RteC domain-containing protein [Bacteroidota bacterium]|nr:RteC domain-containing protein [Bacteroidota bacterium]